jgi:hypothetical protein
MGLPILTVLKGDASYEQAKKAENWLALIQLACAHVLLNLAVLE